MEYVLLIIGSLLAVVLSTILILKNRRKQKKNVPPDVVVLYQLGRGSHTPSVSPFPLKLETFLRMAKIPYMNDHSGRFSTKGKTPWMEYNGKAVADSQFCIEHLKKERGIDVNKHLTKEQIAIAKAFQRLTEENLYWAMCVEMFCGDLTMAKKVIPYTGVKLWMTLNFLQRVLRQETWGQGIGRHTNEEVWDIAVRDMTAISSFLGNKKFFMGDEPCEVDCVLFGMLVSILFNMPGSKYETFVRDDLSNLVSYCERIKERYWPDWDDRILSSPSYKNDHEVMYWHGNENGHAQ